jgi:hypothetical protein
VCWITRNVSQLQLFDTIFADVLGRILQPGSPFTTGIVNSKPQGVCARGRALAVPMFQRRMCSEFGKLSCVVQRSQSPKLLINCRFHKPPSGRYYSESVYFFCENPVLLGLLNERCWEFFSSPQCPDDSEAHPAS